VACPVGAFFGKLFFSRLLGIGMAKQIEQFAYQGKIPRSLELQSPSLRALIDDFAKIDRASVAELPGPIAELVTAVADGVGSQNPCRIKAGIFLAAITIHHIATAYVFVSFGILHIHGARILFFFFCQFFFVFHSSGPPHELIFV
jgi:hypothetical protein